MTRCAPQLVEMSGGQRTVPQIFIGDTHVGGYSDLARLDTEGRLDPMLRPEPEQAGGRPARLPGTRTARD